MKCIGLATLFVIYNSLSLFSQSFNTYSNADTIKKFISEAVYERMVYWETQLKKDDSSLTEAERDGMATYESKYRGNTNWERDSISDLLLSLSWDSCNAQVFTPLVKAFAEQKANKNYDFQSFLNVNVGKSFMNSINYSKLIDKYTSKQQNEELISDTASKYGNQDSAVQSNRKFDTSIPIMKKLKSVFLKVFLWIIIVIGIILLGRWIFSNPHSQRKDNKKRSKQHNTTDFIQDNVESNRKLREQVLGLERENKNLKNKNEEFEREVNQLKCELKRLEDPLNKPPDINQLNNNNGREAETSDQLNKEVIEYYDSHDNGVFNKSKSKNENDRRAIFKIEVNNSNGALHLLTGRMDSILIADKDIFLENVCDIATLPGGNSDKIIVIKPGKVELQGDTWVINTKIQIEIQ